MTRKDNNYANTVNHIFCLYLAISYVLNIFTHTRIHCEIRADISKNLETCTSFIISKIQNWRGTVFVNNSRDKSPINIKQFTVIIFPLIYHLL